MKFHILPFLFLVLAFCSCEEEAGFKEETLPEVKKIKKVLVIGIDGCMPAGLAEANTPNLDSLMAGGTYSLEARNSATTMSGPSWSAMLTGVWEDKHGVTNNSYANANFSQYPPFFERIENVNSDSRTVAVCQWGPINDHCLSPYVDLAINTSSGADTESKAVTQLQSNELTALFVHFDDVDHAGHSSGYSIENAYYIEAIELVDSHIGAVFGALKARRNFAAEDWTIIVSTDHGGIGKGHGGDTDEERTVFVIVNGPDVPKKEIAASTREEYVDWTSDCLGNTSALLFDYDDRVKIQDNNAFNFGSSDDFSIECRIRTKTPGDVAILGKKDWKSGKNPGYVFSFNMNNDKFRVNVGDGSNRVDVDTEVVSDNEWHTLSATFDRDGLLSVYVDGVLSNAKSMAGVTGNINTAFPLTFGADGNNNYRYSGCISEVRIFNGLLGAGDINGWKCKTLDASHPKYADLKGYWKLNEGEGSTIIDHSSVGQNGVLEGAQWITSSSIITVKDYTETPRIVDVAATALESLGIKPDERWNLDGGSLINPGQ